MHAQIWSPIRRRVMAGIRSVYIRRTACLAHRQGGPQVTIQRLPSGSYVLRYEDAEYIIVTRKAYTSDGRPIIGELLARLLRAFDSLIG